MATQLPKFEKFLKDVKVASPALVESAEKVFYSLFEDANKTMAAVEKTRNAVHNKLTSVDPSVAPKAPIVQEPQIPTDINLDDIDSVLDSIEITPDSEPTSYQELDVDTEGMLSELVDSVPTLYNTGTGAAPVEEPTAVAPVREAKTKSTEAEYNRIAKVLGLNVKPKPVNADPDKALKKAAVVPAKTKSTAPPDLNIDDLASMLEGISLE